MWEKYGLLRELLVVLAVYGRKQHCDVAIASLLLRESQKN
ncbi:hypothetical protein KKH3_16260 [Pectobacterium actinidiae]|nr:hypothetical protein KKH3_16260 [Pectobacterium actinidiae]